jgi:hypothetical protein
MRTDSDADRTEAAAARIRYRAVGLIPISPDPGLAEALARGEWLVARRPSVRIDRRHHGEALRPCGDLYVTSERVLVLGRGSISIPLDDIEDAALLGEALVLFLCSGNTVTVETNRPRLLRVQIAAARAARAGHETSSSRGEDQPSPR